MKVRQRSETRDKPWVGFVLFSSSETANLRGSIQKTESVILIEKEGSMKPMESFGVVMAVGLVLGFLALAEVGSEETLNVSEATVNGAIQNGWYEEAPELLEKGIAADQQKEYPLHAPFREAAA